MQDGTYIAWGDSICRLPKGTSMEQTVAAPRRAMNALGPVGPYQCGRRHVSTLQVDVQQVRTKQACAQGKLS